MSEIISNNQDRIEALADFCHRLIIGENGRILIEKHQQIINTVTPTEAMQVLDRILSEGFPIETVKASVGKIINVFNKSLSSYKWERPGEGHFLYYLMLENREVQKIMTELKSVIKIFCKGENQDFPVALRAIPEKAWLEMLEQSYETGWCFIKQPDVKYNTSQTSFNLNEKINLGTGFLNPEKLIKLLNNLTVDITFIDEKDEVQYLSGSEHHIFPRSGAIIGRKVQNCHPPESVHIVNEIITAFRNGQKEHAEFRIQMKDRFIDIRYFALRNEKGIYKGTIEASQDVTEIRSLKGERRLLEWNN